MIGWELWENTVGSGTGGNPGLFIPSPYWSTNTPNAQSGYCGQYLVYGPFGTGSILRYSRSAPAHDFIIIKFFFVRINWATTDSVNFSYLQTSTNTTYQLPLQYVGNGTSSANLSNFIIIQRNSLMLVIYHSITNQLQMIWLVLFNLNFLIKMLIHLFLMPVLNHLQVFLQVLLGH